MKNFVTAFFRVMYRILWNYLGFCESWGTTKHLEKNHYLSHLLMISVI